MTDHTPSLFTSPTPLKCWRVTLANDEVRTVEALTFRCEHGALVLGLPAGCAAVYAPGTWLSIEPEPAQ